MSSELSEIEVDALAELAPREEPRVIENRVAPQEALRDMGISAADAAMTMEVFAHTMGGVTPKYLPRRLLHVKRCDSVDTVTSSVGSPPARRSIQIMRYHRGSGNHEIYILKGKEAAYAEQGDALSMLIDPGFEGDVYV